MKQKHSKLAQELLAHIRAAGLVQAGERVGIAVSGGADSVALLRLLLELRHELGVVLAVVHFDHKIRGNESQGDAEFVAELSKAHGLAFFATAGEVPAYAAERKLTLEEAGRYQRLGFFASLMETGAPLDKIATAHTLDDQAETVLMRLIRGSGMRGLAGILERLETGAPELGEGVLIRPLLGIRRAALRSYLKLFRQEWREDQTNLDRKHLRNRVRHELLPLLEKDFNPRIAELLAHTAELARAEEEYWDDQVATAVNQKIYNHLEGFFDVPALLQQPIAFQRRLLAAAVSSAIGRLDFEHVEALRALANEKATLHPRRLQLPGGEARLIKDSQGNPQLWLCRGGIELRKHFYPILRKSESC